MIKLEEIIRQAIAEDVGNGDHSSLSCIDEDKVGRAELIVKEHGVIAGVRVAREVFAQVDSDIVFKQYIEDGTQVEPGQIAFEVQGSNRSLLLAERLALNLMQRMSGVATVTAKYVKAVEGTEAKILDTRKTTPNLRALEKEAVRLGGGENHRFGLYDMVMLKDNHIDFAGGIRKALDNCRDYLDRNNLDLKIEIETRNLDEVDEVLEVGIAHRIMLDNFNYDDTKEAVNRIAGRFEVESSGGITLETIRGYALCGVDYISVGALTHSVKSLDLSLKAK